MKTKLHISALLSLFLASCSAFESVDQMKQNTDNMGRDTNKMSEQMSLTQQQMTDMSGSMNDMKSGLDDMKGSMDDMKTSMDEMKKSMSDMTSKMDVLVDKMNNMGSSLDKMYGDLRMGDALQARLKSLDEMNNTVLLSAKTSHASHFFISFEHQLWKGVGPDTDAVRLGLMDDAVREFATIAQKYMVSDQRTISVSAEGNEMLNLFALALCMHMQNPSTQRILAANNVPLVSMFDLVLDGLRAGYELRSGKRLASSLKAYEASVLEYEDVFVYLLELRANMFPAMVVGNLSNADATNFTQKWWTRANLFLKPWKSQTVSKNAVQIRMYRTWLSEGITLKKFFSETERKLRQDTLLLRILKNMRIPELQKLASSNDNAGRGSERAVELEKLKFELDSFLGR